MGDYPFTFFPSSFFPLSIFFIYFHSVLFFPSLSYLSCNPATWRVERYKLPKTSQRSAASSPNAFFVRFEVVHCACIHQQYRLDYCNNLLYGVSDSLLAKLQTVQNAAARLITGSSTTSLQFCVTFTGVQSGIVSLLRWQCWFTSSCMVWHRPTWLTFALPSRPSSADGSCGRRTAGHSLCQVQGPPSAGVTSRCPGQ